jgi:hypothetical protein
LDALLPAFARHLGVPPEAARPVLDELVGALRGALDAGEAVTLDGVGRFSREDGEFRFEAFPALLGAVNASFAGFPPIAPPVPPREEPPPAAGDAPALAEDEAPPLFAVPLEVPEPDAEDDEFAAPRFDAPADSASHGPGAGVGAMEEAPIAPIPTAPTVVSAAVEEPEPEVEDAFAAPDAAEALEVEPPPPLRDLSSDVEGEPPETPVAVAVAVASTEEPREEAPPAEEVAAEAADTADLDDELDTILAGVWAPASPSSPDHPLGPTSEPLIEDAEFDVVGEQGEPPIAPAPMSSPAAPDEPADETMEEEAPAEAPPAPAGEETEADRHEARVPPVVVPIPSPAVEAGGPAFTPPPPSAPPRPPATWRPAPVAPRPAPERRRSRGLVFWLPLLLAVAALALVLLWPRGDDAPEDDANLATSTALPADSVAGAADSARVTAQDDEEVPEDIPEDAPPVDAAPDQPARPPAPEPGTPPPTAEPGAPPSAPSSAIPAPLRGPGSVDPARGGATWVLGSGARADAEQDVARYRRQGYRTGVLTGTVNGRTVHRVAVGQFASFQEAQRYRSALPPGAPPDAWVLRLE